MFIVMTEDSEALFVVNDLESAWRKLQKEYEHGVSFKHHPAAFGTKEFWSSSTGEIIEEVAFYEY